MNYGILKNPNHEGAKGAQRKKKRAIFNDFFLILIRLLRLGGEILSSVELTLNKFREFGFVFTKAYPQTTIRDEKNKIFAEIDITLENGDKVMIVEVKAKPSTKDIKDHLERMKKVRRHADLRQDKRTYLGAVAGMIINDNERTFALEKGFYVIEPSGDTFIIIEPKGQYSPREW